MIEYILIGLAISIGWHFGKVIFGVLEEIIFERLHKSKWYKIVVGRMSINEKESSKKLRMKIGF